jgi:methylglyoxal synthase
MIFLPAILNQQSEHNNIKSTIRTATVWQLYVAMQVIFLLSTISKSTTTRMQKGRIFGTAD